MSEEKMKYMRLLAEKYPTLSSLEREIINLSAILNLPKGTEHFMSDIHGEYEAFCHILNNCSGVIREKAERIFRGRLSDEEQGELCTLIYYPKEKLSLLDKENAVNHEWYRTTLEQMLELARDLSSKYTRSKVRKAMPEDFAYIIDELMHAQPDEDDNQVRYHNEILETILRIDAEDFVIALAELIKRLAVDRLHIVGDIFDRGDSADRIVELLMKHPCVDIEWGNHDILWMGAACGSDACIANVVRNCIKYRTMATLENGYGISLRKLTLFAQKLYPDLSPMDAALKAITVIQFKLEGQIILRNSDYNMNDRLILHTIDMNDGTFLSEGERYKLNDTFFPTLDKSDPYRLTDGEQKVVAELRGAFLNSARLQGHVAFLFENGGMYRRCNGNLLYHGCVPMNDSGSFETVYLFGEQLSGREYFDTADEVARLVFFGEEKNLLGLDFMWYLWCSPLSPLCGRKLKTFERAFTDDKTAWHEEKNPYYRYYYEEFSCDKILEEFGLDSDTAHIINGHTPVRTVKGELPIRAGGKLLVIDGGFCEKYHDTTGIAGYTLIYNSHGLRLKTHRPFCSVEEALKENQDIISESEIIETRKDRMMVADTDDGAEIKRHIGDLQELLYLYRCGTIRPQKG
ncbi:MAG: fructose-1,6-bisphosphatase [Ruminococcus sp.]|uniref:fructose-1,6-bisphosphatase n=1 Tax=Ruminococcus sp. TaxID=41978 RepID=UPI002873D053|nr:fructose-1,6-bisphosphatase [Ruminococcus sp.]MBQ3284174.1 fructose-1,6-bisphosphatase [Ruminococcus sp.]